LPSTPATSSRAGQRARRRARRLARRTARARRRQGRARGAHPARAARAHPRRAPGAGRVRLSADGFGRSAGNSLPSPAAPPVPVPHLPPPPSPLCRLLCVRHRMSNFMVGLYHVASAPNGGRRVTWPAFCRPASTAKGSHHRRGACARSPSRRRRLRGREWRKQRPPVPQGAEAASSPRSGASTLAAPAR
jgi:hypothetical protein